MYRFKLTLSGCIFALLLASGCDALQDDAQRRGADEPSAPLVDEQIDYSLVSKEQEAMLLSDAPLNAAALRAHGFRLRGAVFTMSDAAEGNEVLAFYRESDGRLTPAGAYPTQGLGSGDGLNGTSNPVALARGNRFLFVVNGGSDEISIFHVDGASLQFVDVISSGGLRPISITAKRDIVYVLNAGREGEPGNVTGFRIQRRRLAPLFGSTQPLNDGAGSPSQIAFNPLGTQLVVTDKPTNTITTYPVDDMGRAGAPNTQPSHGETAFGFDFDREGRLLVSEAFGGAENASAVSSYLLNGGILLTLSESVPTMQTAACWVETFGRYAYTTNTGSSSITGYLIADDGTLTRLDEDGVTFFTGEGSAPLDMDVALRYLYVHSAGTNRIGAYRIEQGGGLTSISGGAATGLPPTAVGVAAF